ncbi:MAG: SprT-like domain-containing protein [Flavisolibacter sp.]|nr:SprT-like domain-containing protein [Flavisolibacter sp.]MBD0367417.1 SprT-like domain-containing protein [Flavisolibacter sp.]
MPKKEAPIDLLKNYLPPATFEPVLHYLQQYRVHLTIARERKSILGNYRHRTGSANHRISVNGNLNKYSFLITLLHELAHLLAFEQYGNRIASHGREWKAIFGQLLHQFLQQHTFPDDIKNALSESLHNPAATTCADAALQKVLKRYDERTNHLVFIENIPSGALFRTHDGKLFRKGEQLRKRFRCVEVQTGKIYLFSPVYEAKLVESQ